MSTVKTNNVQIGQSATASNNFVLSVPNVPDGSLKISRGNVGATTQDLIVVGADNSISIPGNGEIVGATDTQTLTNKTISVDSNTVSGIAASSFVVSDASGNIDGAAAQKAIPTGAVVGTSDSQTLTNKTINGSNNTITNISLSTSVTGTLPIANGGTGATIAATALSNLGGINTGKSIAMAMIFGF